MKKISFTIALLMLFQGFAYAYTDVDSSPNKVAIDYITQQGIVQGYSDDTYRPERSINRAEFTKIIVEAKLKSNPTESAANCFPDVSESEWFASYVCYAKAQNWIGGYPDNTFKPGDSINVVESAKILVNVLEVPKVQPSGGDWYHEFIESMEAKNYLPNTFKSLNQKVTRGEMAEMIWRILEQKTDQPSVTVAQLEDPCLPLGEKVPSSIDMNQVRSAWLGWYNQVRRADGLHDYKYNDQLARTAIVWSELSEQRGYMDHRRDPGDAYYDYWKITDWFKNLGLEFKNVNRVTHTENIGWGTYRCSDSDCTDELISAIRLSFDFYMAEKGKDYTAHYDSVMNRYFNEIGLGIAIDESAGKYYLTVHYGTEITSNPDPICQ